MLILLFVLYGKSKQIILEYCKSCIHNRANIAPKRTKNHYCLVKIWHRVHLVQKASSLRVFVENVWGQLFNFYSDWGSKMGQMIDEYKSQKGKSMEWDVNRDFEKLPTYPWTSRRTHSFVGLCTLSKDMKSP